MKSTNKTKVIFNIDKQIKILLENLQITKTEMYKLNIFYNAHAIHIYFYYYILINHTSVLSHRDNIATK